MLTVAREHASLIQAACSTYISRFQHRFYPLFENTGLSTAADFGNHVTQVHQLYERMTRVLASSSPEVPEVRIADTDASLIRTVISACRLDVAQTIEARREHVTSDELVAKIEAVLEPYTALMGLRWLRNAIPVRVPRESEYFPVSRIDAELAKHARATDFKGGKYDEKFGILRSPALFLPDLHDAREAARVRDTSLVVA